MKKILITGKNSYLGNAVEQYILDRQAAKGEESWQMDRISLRGDAWKKESFSGYDTVLHMAGMAHADVGKVSDETKALYYHINRDLTLQAAQKAKADGVRQFIYMSSVIIYGDSAPVGKQKHITAETPPAPANFYGDSKYQAERQLRKLQAADFRVAIVRAPMIYGKGCKGNFSVLVKLAARMPVFPALGNQRSMLYVENLAEFLRLLMEAGTGGTFFPQNAEYVRTDEMVRLIGKTMGRRIRLWRMLNPFVKLASKVPGRIGGLADKAFGSLTVDRELSSREITGYQICSLEESIRRSCTPAKTYPERQP